MSKCLSKPSYRDFWDVKQLYRLFHLCIKMVIIKNKFLESLRLLERNALNILEDSGTENYKKVAYFRAKGFPL